MDRVNSDLLLDGAPSAIQSYHNVGAVVRGGDAHQLCSLTTGLDPTKDRIASRDSNKSVEVEQLVLC